jgi:hypothetical protein
MPGAVLLFDEQALIWHRVRADRRRFGYYGSRCYAEGLSKAMVTREVGADDGLSSERRHASRILPRGVAHGLADAVRGDLSGLTRAGAIVAGLAAVTAGYVAGTAGGGSLPRWRRPGLIGPGVTRAASSAAGRPR